ncbi:MAG: hypothetical protein HOO06_03380 [Bdellovibrionaceae bacterium]|jgi:hypothetical protein|nr:hypothetical protein [Pseudobdellovibrionaceae bacterium]
MKKIILILMVLQLTSGCAFLRSVSTTSVPKNRKNKVSAQAEKFYFLGFNFSNSYVDGLVQDLADQCPKGKVQGILTKHEVISYVFFTKNIVSANGYCVKR